MLSVERKTNRKRGRISMYKLLTVIFGTMVLFSLTLPSFARDTGSQADRESETQRKKKKKNKKKKHETTGAPKLQIR